MTTDLRIGATLYRKYIKSPTFANKETHRKYRNLFTACNRKAADMYYRDIIDARKQNVRTLWSIFGPIINPTKTRKSTKIQQLTHKGLTHTNNKDIANTLNNYFSTIGTTLTENMASDTNYISYLKNPIVNSLYLEPIQITEMVKVIENLKNKKSPGPTV